MSFLNREQIIGAADRQYVEVDVPEWGGTVRLRSLDAEQALHQEVLVKKRNAGDLKINPLAAILSVSIVDASGTPLFNDKDMNELGKKSPAILIRLVKAVNTLNKLEEDVSGDSEGTPASS